MRNEKMLSIALIVLAISIVFSSLWIGYKIDKSNIHDISEQKRMDSAGLMNQESAAMYLGISLKDFRQLLADEQNRKSGLNGYPTYKFIPFMEIGKNNVMFSKTEIDKWIEYNMLNK